MATLVFTATLVGCGSPTPPTPPPPPKVEAPDTTAWPEVFPHVRLDRDNARLAIHASAIVDTERLANFDLYLETLLTTPDGRSHEALFLTQAVPSEIHATLLMAGFTAGTPGAVLTSPNGTINQSPTGSPVAVEFWWEGLDRPMTASALVRFRTWNNAGEASDTTWDPQGYVFAGSIIDPDNPRPYRADREGDIIGIATFGGEVIAARNVRSHDSGIAEPAWTAQHNVMPPNGTPVTILITLLDSNAADTGDEQAAPIAR